MTQPEPAVHGAVPPTFYDEVGGRPAFELIVDRFYEAATIDPVLQPLFAATDSAAVRGRMTAFFVQYWGGPRDYSRERGEPRLALRHRRFRIGPAERDAFLAAMRGALSDSGLTAEQQDTFLGYLGTIAGRLMGRSESPRNGGADRAAGTPGAG